MNAIKRYKCYLTQVCVPDTQWGQTNPGIRVWNRERQSKENRRLMPKNLKLSSEFSEKSLYRQNLGWGLQHMFWLIGGEVTGKNSRNMVVFMKLTILHVGGSLSSCRRTQETVMYNILLEEKPGLYLKPALSFLDCSSLVSPFPD